MTLEITKLIDSGFDMLNKLGSLLYGREDEHGGLTKEELYQLLEIVCEETVEEIYLDGEFNGACNAMH